MSGVTRRTAHGDGLGAAVPPRAWELCGLGWPLACPGGVWLARGRGLADLAVGGGVDAAVGDGGRGAALVGAGTAAGPDVGRAGAPLRAVEGTGLG
jgi:hypothetical protein